MKKSLMFIAVGGILITLSSCGQTKNVEEIPFDSSNSAGEMQETQNDEIVPSTNIRPTENLKEEGQPLVSDKPETDLYEGVYASYDINEPALEIIKNHDGTYQIEIDLFRLWSIDDGAGTVTEKGLEFSATGPSGNEIHGVIQLEEDIATVTILEQEWVDFAGLSEYKFYKTSNTSDINVPESLIGEYEYLSDYGSGRLMIQKTSAGYDISDYESEDSYRFLADSSNIETIENNRIYIKYPERVFPDDTVVFGYYILEYSTDGINVYYGKSASDKAQFLYHATKKKEASTIE